MGFKRWLVEKCVIYAMVFAVFYIIGETLGIIPQPLKDLVTWVSENFTVLALFVCFLAMLFVVYRLAQKRREEYA